MQGEIATVKCISNYGNPPPVLKWLLDLDEIRSPRKQTNSTELDNPKTWMATSLLELAITKDSHGRLLKCVAYHESYPSKSASTEVRLNVMFVPETRLIGVPATDIEEFIDTVAIRCQVNANPRANVVWKKEGLSQPVSLQELLKFSPVTRQNSGLYTCHARNAAGEAPPLRFNLSIKYPPKILSVGPDRLTTSPLYTSATFECIAEGNPLPTYQWLQRLPTRPNYVREQGREAKLHISNVTYDHQGEYVCKAVNIIGGMEREVQSESVVLQVVGAPQILKFLLLNEIEIERGDTANISLIICSDPRPKFVAWEWGSLQLEAGSQIGKYKADELIQDLREDCYISVLHIQDADATDSRAYHLMAENDRGKDRHTVKLFVNEPFRINTVLIFACGITTALLLLICVCLYTLRTENCCPTKKNNYKENNLNGQRLDVENKSLRLEAIPSDAIYTAKREPNHDNLTVNPDTLKSSSTIFKHEDNPDNGNGEYVLERRSRLNGKLDSFPVISFDPQSVSYAGDLKSQQQNQKETNDVLDIKKEFKDSKRHSVYCKTMTVRPSRSQIRVNGIHNNKQDDTQSRTSTLRSNSGV
ncbi:peroxidasin isoform X1 [Agrilus planipennis]|nr:peroxidasin isoform X1 [Agrilus planipennis]